MLQKVFVISLLITLSGLSAALTPPNYHLDIAFGQYNVVDPDGEADPRMLASVSFGTSLGLSRNLGLGLWSELGYYGGTFSKFENGLNVKVNSLYTNQILQKSVYSNNGLSVILGTGLGLGLNDYTERMISDEEGFLDRRLEDRSTIAVNGILQTGLFFKRMPLNAGRYRLNIKPGILVNYSLPLGDDVSAVEMKLFAIF